jgi:hypothetical protein
LGPDSLGTLSFFPGAIHPAIGSRGINAGLPFKNGGNFLTVGLWDGEGGILQSAIPNEDYPLGGGTPEIFFPNGDADKHIKLAEEHFLPVPIRFPFGPKTRPF